MPRTPISYSLEADKKEVAFDLASAHKIADNVRAKSESIFSELLKMQPLAYEPKAEPVKKTAVKEIKKEIPEKPAMKEIKVEVKKDMPEIILPEPKIMRQNNAVNGQKSENGKKLVEEARKRIEDLKEQEIIEEEAGIKITSPIKEYDIREKDVSFKPKPKPIEIEIKAEEYKPISNQAKPPQIKPQSASDILAIHPLPKKSGLPKKIFARILSITLLAALLFINVTFWYWYIFVRPKNMPPAAVITSPIPTPECAIDKDCASGKICSQDGKCNDKPIVIVGPIFPMTGEKEFKISSYSDIPGIMLNVISEWPNEEGFAVDKFRRIVIINESERRQATIKEIFDALLITAPDGFYERLGENYTLFEYSQKEGIRIGLVSSIIDKENFAKLLSQNEGTMKDGFRTFFSLMNLESPVTTKVFASASKMKGYTGPDFRYLPVSKNDLGVCYSAYADYFMLSTSFESMKKALESLKNQLTASPSPSVLPTASPSATPK